MEETFIISYSKCLLYSQPTANCDCDCDCKLQLQTATATENCDFKLQTATENCNCKLRLFSRSFPVSPDCQAQKENAQNG